MFQLITSFFKHKFIDVITKVNIKDACKSARNALKQSKKKIKDTVVEEIKPSSVVKEPRWQRRFPFSFFYGGGKFQPIYAWIFCFCSLAVGMLFVKIYAAWIAIKKGTYDSEMISTADLATVLAFISSLILLYNNGKKNKISAQSEKPDKGN